MTLNQYDVFLEDLRSLREALGLPAGALPISPRAAFLECIVAAERLNSYRNGRYSRAGKEAYDRA